MSKVVYMQNVTVIASVVFNDVFYVIVS
jgi:hypothetical protein